MKKVAIALLVCGTAAFAEEIYGVPTQFRILTLEEVRVDVALHGYVGSWEDDVYEGAILEPVLFKCINGAPGHYYVLTFKGTNPKNREAIEGIRKLLSDEDGFYLEEISPFLDTARDNYKDYCTFICEAWDFGGCYCKTAAIDNLLYEFEIYVEIAQKCLGIKGSPKIKLYAVAPFGRGLIFALKDPGKEERFMWSTGMSGWVLDEEGRVEKYGGFGEATRDEIAERYDSIIERLTTKSQLSPNPFDEDVEYWAGLREEMGAIEKEDGYYHIIIPERE